MKFFHLRNVQDEQEFGGKAVQLGIALRYGLPVPDGYALSKTLVQSIAKGDQLATKSLNEIIEVLGSNVAVRSSAAEEDGKNASYAGQFKSYLNVSSVGELENAVLNIRNSIFSNHVIAYNNRFGSSRISEIGVIVQKMVDADVSGVLFTRNPINGLDERIIEASWGLGESCVSGLITPDFLRVSRGGQIIECKVGVKDVAIYPKSEGGIGHVQLTDSMIHELCLKNDQIKQLDHIAKLCEQCFGNDRDIEWSFCGSTCYLLQCRPITLHYGGQ